MAGWRIMFVGTYFRSDRLDGLGLDRDFETPEEGARFARLCEESLPELDMMGSPEQAIAWLERIGRNKPPSCPIDLATRITLTVHWLERRRHIQTDDHNGLIWLGQRPDGDGFALRYDQPHGPVWDEFCRGVRVETRTLERRDFERTVREILGAPPEN